MNPDHIWRVLHLSAVRDFFAKCAKGLYLMVLLPSTFTKNREMRQKVRPKHGGHCDTARQALSLSYGRYIAEFLKEGSLVHLGLLDLSTCVGLRYG